MKLETLKNDIIKKIDAGQLVPVVGDNVFYVKDKSGKDILLQKFVVIRLINKLKGYGVDCDFFNSNIIDNAYNGYKVMSVLNRLFVKAGGDLSEAIIKIYEEHEIHKNSYIDPDVKEFLELGKFPLIITTSYTNILEYHLTKEYREVYYLKEQKDIHDIGSTDNTAFEKLETPTIFHIFGINKIDCTLTENDFLKYLHALHDTDSRPVKLMQYLKKRYILTLGCSIPDWTLRFLLYSFKSDKIYDAIESGNKFKGGVIDMNNDNELADFLDSIDYLYESTDSNHISDSKTSLIIELSSIMKKIKPSVEKRKMIFISVFSSEDLSQTVWRKLIMDEVVCPLRDKYDIWFCEDQLEGYAGEAYWQKIREGLERCDYFMPVLTPNLISFLEENSDTISSAEPIPEKEQGIITEWKYALDIWIKVHNKRSGFCIPFNLANKFERIQRVFFPKNNQSSGIGHLRKLIFGDGEGTNAMGNQIVSEVDKIKI